MNLSVIIGAAVLLIIVIFAIICYNGLVAKSNLVEEAFSGMDVIFKKRYDLIPNLVETIKGYASYEKETLAEIVSLRNQALNASQTNEKIQLDNNISQSVTKILALSENYPDLKASTNFLALQSELSLIETDIERAKRYYNGTIRDYNVSVQSFPNNLVAGIFRFSKKDFLELFDVTQRETPKVQF